MVAEVRGTTVEDAAAAALRVTEERLALALKASRAGYFDWDTRTNRIVWSSELLDLYGLGAKEFGGRFEDWYAALLPEDRRHAGACVKRALETGIYECEFRIRRRDTGEVRWMYGRGEVYFDAERRPTRMLGTNVDVTERKLAEEQLRRSNEGLARLSSACLAVVRETELSRMVQATARAALLVTGARHAAMGYGFGAGRQVTWTSASALGVAPRSPEELFDLDETDLFMPLVEGRESLRIGEDELQRWARPSDSGKPRELRGLLGARLASKHGRTTGLILVTDDERGQFNDEDESLLRQLAMVASLALADLRR